MTSFFALFFGETWDFWRILGNFDTSSATKCSLLLQFSFTLLSLLHNISTNNTPQPAHLIQMTTNNAKLLTYQYGYAGEYGWE